MTHRFYLNTPGNIRMKLSCWLISQAIKTLPKDWRKKNAVKNLISTGFIGIDDGE